MSKSIRLPDYLATEVERLAASEKRSLANMVKVLLEQALTLNGTGNPTGEMAASSLPSEKAEPVPAVVNQSGDKGRRPTPGECGMSNRHSMNSKLNPCPRCGYPT
jgi:hypothetical protein